MANHPNRSKRQNNPATNPTSEEIRNARITATLTQAEAADLVYTTLRNWQQWESDIEGDTRRMHPATWGLFKMKVRYQRYLMDLGAFNGRTDQDPERPAKIERLKERLLADLVEYMGLFAAR